jgi:hypothetical protein
MNPTYKHNLLSAFYLWFDHHLTDKVAAYTNMDSDFYYYADERITNKTVYGAPFKQFIYDDSVTSATVIASVSGDGGLIPKGTSGMKVDFNEGRIIFDNTVATDLNISGSFAVKDFNIYITNENEEDLIMEKKFKNNARYTRTETYVAPYDQATPAVFLSHEGAQNQPFALGGEDATMSRIKAIIFAEDMFKLDGILSVFEDTNEKCVSKIPFTGAPLGEYGDIKAGAYPTGFNYNDIAANYNTDTFYIKEAITSKFRDRASKAIAPGLFIGFIDFEVEQYRYPRL